MKQNKKISILLAIVALLVAVLLIRATGIAEYLYLLGMYALFFGGIGVVLLGLTLIFAHKYRKLGNNLITIGGAVVISCIIWAFVFAASYHF
jgi:Mn2+/Fe2+ NRAMP family transporter